MNGDRKPLFWLSGEIKSPPFSDAARAEAGGLLGRLQDGHAIGMPLSRPMPGIGARCHELRVPDEGHNWRIVHRIDTDAILVLAVFAKTTPKTPRRIIEACKSRLRAYDQI